MNNEPTAISYDEVTSTSAEFMAKVFARSSEVMRTNLALGHAMGILDSKEEVQRMTAFMMNSVLLDVIKEFGVEVNLQTQEDAE